MKTEPNHGAFASQSETYIQDGLTKREYFAAMAMQGFCSAERFSFWEAEQIARLSLKQADAMIVILNKEETNEV